MQNIQIKLGDCIDIMSEMRDNSIDSIVTDPPAGIAFMGKDWDKDKGGRDEWIKWMTRVAAQCLRVLKPGGHALVWALPRTSHWTATAWEDAGFEVRDRIEHIFGSGFPKSLNVKKQIEKEWECKLEKVTVNNVIDLLYQNSGLKEMDGQDSVVENVWGIIKNEESIELANNAEKNFSFLNVTLKEKIEEIRGLFVATFVNLNGKNNLMVNLIIIGEGEDLLGQTDMWLLTSEMENIGLNTMLLWKRLLEEELLPMKTSITITKLEQIIDLKIWNSLQYRNTLNCITSVNGTALKPSVEDWWLFRKPISEKTVARNVLKWGTGAININASRVPIENSEDSIYAKNPHTNGTIGENGIYGKGVKTLYNVPQGRWPAQVIHDGSEEVLELFPQTGSGHFSGKVPENGGLYKLGLKQVPDRGYTERGSAARFFYCAKPSRKERNDGLDDLESKPVLIGAEGHKINPMTEKSVVDIPRKNGHPTVKPLSLMRYLITLITPPNGIVLDPFLGSGTTLVAVKELGFSGRGIENDLEYLKIAEARIANAKLA